MTAASVARERFPRQASLSNLGNLTVLCGNNGSGKSSMLSLIHAALTADVSRLSPHLAAGHVRLDVIQNSRAASRSIDLTTSEVVGASSPFPSVLLLDAARDAQLLKARFIAEANFEELLEQYDANELSPRSLELVRYVSRKNYARVSVTEVDDLGSDVDAVDETSPSQSWPFFTVSDGQSTYDTRTMGAGELAAMLLLWSLSNAVAGSCVLIEEPETYVSPASQAYLMNAIARIAVERNLWVLLSTHSVELLHRVPASAIRMAEVVGGDVVLRTPTNLAEVRSTLGVRVAPSSMVLVEDRLAGVLLHELLVSKGVFAALGARIEVAGSAEKALLAATSLQGLEPPMRAIAVLDGDQRDQTGGSGLGPLFLPGSACPEQELIDAMGSLPGSAARALGRQKLQIEAALTFVQGQDPHEAWHTLTERLDINSETMTRAMVRVWLQIRGVKPQRNTLASELLKALAG
ncbi:AAA family ATPase [Georgenia sp. MJ206]|uniref:ATP-dependent nuclease n=1 Tax=Georgenia wangjunii TaxID=3117730 RepID=UPI002F263DFA